MKLILRILITAFIVVGLSRFLPGAHINDFWTGIWVAIAMGLMNVFVKPILIIFTLPITLFTFGLFLLVINAIIIMLCSNLVTGFVIDSFGWAFLFSLLLSFCQSILFATLRDSNQNPSL